MMVGRVKWWDPPPNKYSLSFKISVVLANCTYINEWNEIIIRYNIFTKLPLLYKKKNKLKVALKIVWEKSWRG